MATEISSGGTVPPDGWKNPRALRCSYRRSHSPPHPAAAHEARRFNILIDTLYELRILLIASAEVPPDGIYTAGDGTFEFRRTISRLVEMQSAEYIANRPRD